MTHDHAPAAIVGAALDRRLWAAAALNAAITLAELEGGLLSGSLALLSDAAHNLSDVVAVVLALWRGASAGDLPRSGTATASSASKCWPPW